MLTPAQVQHFQDYGYTTAESFFEADEIQAMLTELERFKREGLGHNVVTEGDGLTPSSTRVNYQVIPLHDKSSLFRALPFADKVITAISQLIGHPVVRHLDQLFLKPARSGEGTAWHQDNAYFKIADPTKATAMWIALHEATLENGTLHVIPNSHREAFEHSRDLNSDHHIHIEVDESRAVPLVLPAGGVAFFNYGTAHATKRNNSDRERAGVAYHFFNYDHREGVHISDHLVHLSGVNASGGEREYGQRIAGSWHDVVAALSAGS
jgi:ectoine hydroxylase-related dioxygenase (phytanoyl-CoA dioxygenase family)